MQQKPWKGTEQRPPHQLRHHHLSQALPARFPQEKQEQSLSSLSKQAPASPFHEDRFQQRFPYLGQLQHLGAGPLPVLKAGATPLQRSQENFPVRIPAGPNSWSCLSIYKTIPTVVCNGNNTNISDLSRLTSFLISEGFGRPSGSVECLELLDGRKLGKAAWRRLPSAKKRNSM